MSQDILNKMNVKESQDSTFLQEGRNNFAYKSFKLLFVKLLSMTLIVVGGYNVPYSSKYQQANSTYQIVLAIGLCLFACCLHFAMKNSMIVTFGNFILGIIQAQLIIHIYKSFEGTSIWQCVLKTALLVLVLISYSMNTSTDYTKQVLFNNDYFYSCFVLLVSMPTVLRFIEDGSEHSVNLSILLMIASGLLIIVHVQQINGGKQRSISLDQVFKGSLLLYIDIIVLLTKSLVVFGRQINS